MERSKIERDTDVDCSDWYGDIVPNVDCYECGHHHDELLVLKNSRMYSLAGDLRFKCEKCGAIGDF